MRSNSLFERCRRVRLLPSLDVDLSKFDCGDSDLNEFLQCDAFEYAEKLIAATYVYVLGDMPVAFVCYSNDLITYKARKKSSLYDDLKTKPMPEGFGQRLGWPAVKIGRLGVHKEFANQGLGSAILDFTKAWFLDDNKTGCRFITLDAYPKAIPFYIRNKFRLFILPKGEPKSNIPMFFDLYALTS